MATFWIALCIVMIKVLGGGTGGVLSHDIGGAADTNKPGVNAPPQTPKQPSPTKVLPRRAAR